MKVACTVRVGGKDSDYFKVLPIHIQKRWRVEIKHLANTQSGHQTKAITIASPKVGDVQAKSCRHLCDNTSQTV